MLGVAPAPSVQFPCGQPEPVVGHIRATLEHLVRKSSRHVGAILEPLRDVLGDGDVFLLSQHDLFGDLRWQIHRPIQILMGALQGTQYMVCVGMGRLASTPQSMSLKP